jgi:2-dehydro-3-deoxy-D-arabinonate dehydratase
VILYRTQQGISFELDGVYYSMRGTSLNDLFTFDNLHGYLTERAANMASLGTLDKLLAPVEGQEVWASGVTYYRSRSARMEESKEAGGGDFYDRVYTAERPELFFKSVGNKVRGTNQKVRIRSDAKWSVPEPELTLAINSRGEIIGYTIGNDLSSRDIEGQNPLYLPQAKVYDGSCAIGPGILIQDEPMPSTTEISLEIARETRVEFSAGIALSEMKRDPRTLVEYLYRDQTFPVGCFLLTGTGIVPPDTFALQSGDEIRITITGIGTLINQVA